MEKINPNKFAIEEALKTIESYFQNKRRIMLTNAGKTYFLDKESVIDLCNFFIKDGWHKHEDVDCTECPKQSPLSQGDYYEGFDEGWKAFKNKTVKILDIIKRMGEHIELLADDVGEFTLLKNELTK